MSVAGSLSQHARSTPERVAVVCDSACVTWRELDRAVLRIASHLAATVPAGRGVALHLPNGPALVMLFLAACRAGREAQILDPGWPAAMAQSVIAALSPGLVVTTDAGLSCAAPLLRLNSDIGFHDVAEALGAAEAHGMLPEPDPLQPFCVGFTSGSTGMPKGFRRHHRSWTESFRAGDREFDIGANDVVLAPGTLTHSLFLYALAHGLDVGATVVLCRQFRPTAANRLIREHRATVIYGVPTQLEAMLDAADRACEEPFAELRWILSSGAKWKARSAAALRTRFPAARFAEFYGASELSFTTVVKDDEAVPPDSVGRAFRDVVITIRDHAGRLLPPGEAGLVFVESPFVFMEYACGASEPPRRVGDAITVGDVGRLDDRGFLHLVGRASRMIITSGKNVHPEEVERVLELHPAVDAAAVFGVSDRQRGERLVAMIRLRAAAASIGRAELIRHARAALPLYKVPRKFALPRLWPTTRSGKADFAALAAMWEQGDCEAVE